MVWKICFCSYSLRILSLRRWAWGLQARHWMGSSAECQRKIWSSSQVFFTLNYELIFIIYYFTYYRLQDHPHCGVVCGPHRTVRTAPTLKAQKSPHNHNFPTIHFNLFCQFLEEKNFSKRFLKFFCQNIEKNLTNDLCGWCAGVDNTTLKPTVVLIPSCYTALFSNFPCSRKKQV